MKNLFESQTVEDVISRIEQLQPASQRQWGKMDAAQMLAHCSAAMDMATGRLNLKRAFVGRILGPIVKPFFLNEAPLRRNAPTARELIFSKQEDFAREQATLRDKIREFQQGGEARCTRHPHPFFGPLTPQQWARGMYKHLDHHLRQFAA